MNKSISGGFEVLTTKGKVYFNKGFLDYDVVKLVDTQKQVRYVSSDVNYIKLFIDDLKNMVIRKLPCLNLVNIQLSVLDKNKILDRFIITVSNMLQDLLKCKQKIDFNKTIVVCVEYDNQIVFLGGLNFTGLN